MSIKARIGGVVALHYVVWLVIFVVTMAIAFAGLGCFFLLAPPLGSAGAAFVVGGGLIGLLVLIGLIAWVVIAVRKRRAARRKAPAAGVDHHSSEAFIEHQLRPIIGDRATIWARENPGLLAVGALSAGVLLAASPSIRRTLFRSARPILIRRGMSAITGGD